MLQRVNLIPIHRRVAKQRRKCVRAATAVSVGWGIACGILTIVSLTVWGRPDPELDAKLQRAQTSVESANRALTAVNTELNAAQSTLRATQAIADQPDWSIILALLGKSASTEIILQNCEVVPLTKEDPSKKKPAAPTSTAKSYVVKAYGIGQSPAAVQSFVLRVEQSGLFSRVAQLGTSPETFLDRKAIGFKIECTLDGQAPAVARSKPKKTGTGIATTDVSEVK